ncbi:MAG: YkgJ family cysteine cluster protein [Theionarchaea archaeon]|nr:YkgJ family cysteine cluster protein [Theionarchaea archaeon]MBU7020808.1 YkgJ family cysteine cluster protein [Theionarchaea archaeon]MBU7034796.1 YkgJ family cysteine cluster protein [Theionarchaea archaeon]MBU7040291.1 YkgJ family cysteine cluster protein [Theionarchaea archaeon]
MEMGSTCRICGQQCCRKTKEFGKIALSEKDYVRIQLHIQGSFAKKVYSKNGWIYLMEIFEGKCVFLQEDGNCAINSFKPLDCKIYPLLFQYSGGEITFFVSSRCPFHHEVTSEFAEGAEREARDELEEWSEQNLKGYSEIVSPNG